MSEGKQYYVTADENGSITGFYLNTLHRDKIPNEAVPITEEEWEMSSGASSSFIFENGVIREKTQEELDDEIANLPPRKPTALEILQEADLDNKEAIATLYEMILGGQINES